MDFLSGGLIAAFKAFGAWPVNKDELRRVVN